SNDSNPDPTENPIPPEETMDAEPPRELISLERAQAMYKAYEERARALSELKDGESDSRYAWHSLKFYKQYFAYLEREARKVGIKVSGIRTYYVAYPDDDNSGKYADYQTFFYVPTYFNKDKNAHIAFDPLHLDENGKPLPIHEIITGDKKPNPQSMATDASSPNETSSSVANMAEMCEPNCSDH
ncbi:hypothetical protein, partial [Fulvivirga aurantia]|uniref:hypothetical protein n=1 Tax=Fulvivirga aurantia TaxID=2529383 RepID=UPI001CA3D8C5